MQNRGRLLKLKNADGGFALIELVVGIVIFTMILLTIFQLFAFSSTQNKRTDDLSELASVAERSMEFIKGNMTLEDSDSYKELLDYTMDNDTKQKFFVAYKAKEIGIANPDEEEDITDSLPSKAVNYKISVEVCFRTSSSRLSPLGEHSRKSEADSKKILMVTLSSKATQYE